MSHTELRKLAFASLRHTTADDSINTSIPALQLSQFSSPTELTALVYDPCICIVMQGAKEVVLSGQPYHMAAGDFLLVSVDLPVDARVVSATSRAPYLGLKISIDPRVVAELLADGSSVGAASPSARGLAVTAAHPQLLEAVSRLVGLLDEPQDIGPLAPLIQREITHRVLTSSQGIRLRQIALAGAPASRIAEAIRWLRVHFAEPLRIETLAGKVGLSTSTFHLHFKNVTTMTPLQYQKRMRLQEARGLMIGEKLDAATAAYRVGYESPSQFSREYRRQYGASPRQDVDAVLTANSQTQ
ncbi:MAG: AraC family transcriptional regulator [Planctomycetales bacterium]|nr:AraC family transcriptional regulator [Planctomycetales bacterium]